MIPAGGDWPVAGPAAVAAMSTTKVAHIARGVPDSTTLDPAFTIRVRAFASFLEGPQGCLGNEFINVECATMGLGDDTRDFVQDQQPLAFLTSEQAE